MVAAVAVAGMVTWRSDFWADGGVVRTAQQPSGEAVTTGLTLYAAGSRPQVPELRGQTLDGEQLALADLRGHVLVINVWGSWCQPCRKEAPDLARVARETAGRGVRFVGIDTRDNPAAARAFVRAFKVPYPSIIDDGHMMLAFHGVIPVSAIPSTVVVDPAGKIAARVVGKTDYSTLRGLVDDVLDETPATTSGSAKGGS
ncbi:thiol-disulfide isomerase/thioredoxin [Kribbella aluminosa]|uniref:Thiol-disulfide isomerase/thioredoxin n=1 Tax=Kribbella aluminosa TaxID=416017 RepID=A0ABS4UBF3_9ACTN|nr:TlpA disulfide reductase family protein [Kribbella aluminosa]MBP2348977.1 thiol-disulfide isomerase/thioredoxin [Kribbella aluminosa]